MKINFSKYWHFFYCAVIAALSYLYYNAAWSAEYYDSILETRKVLRRCNEVLDAQNEVLLREVEKAAEDGGDTTNRKGINAANDYVENSKKIVDYFRKCSSQLIESCGGHDSKYTDGRMVNSKFYFLTSNYFDRQKINEMIQSVMSFENDRKLIINNLDKRFSGDFQFTPIIKDSVFWNRLADVSPANVLQKLEEIINNIKVDELQALNYFYQKMGTSCMYCGQPKLDIITEQVNVENQDYYEGYVALIERAFICKNRGIQVYANGKKLPYKENDFYLKYKPTKLGKNEINLECRITNPLTGETKRINKKRYFYAK